MKVYSSSVQGKRDSNEDQHFIYTNLDGNESDKNNVNSCWYKVKRKACLLKKLLQTNT